MHKGELGCALVFACYVAFIFRLIHSTGGSILFALLEVQSHPATLWATFTANSRWSSRPQSSQPLAFMPNILQAASRDLAKAEEAQMAAGQTDPKALGKLFAKHGTVPCLRRHPYSLLAASF